MSKLKYVNIYKSESWGSNGSFGLEINVAGSKLPDLKLDEIGKATDHAQRLIESAIRKEAKAADPKTPEEIAENRKIVDEVFSEPIFVEEIKNQYCSDWCCAHLPWFRVTTKKGVFVIGWRKRVISINWDLTVSTKDAEDLFQDENTTKYDKSIHAWGLEKAKEYVAAILKG
jgi:hypothetical protein